MASAVAPSLRPVTMWSTIATIPVVMMVIYGVLGGKGKSPIFEFPYYYLQHFSGSSPFTLITTLSVVVVISYLINTTDVIGYNMKSTFDPSMMIVVD